MIAQSQMQHSTSGSSLADILERVLDKGVVIAGDIKIKLVDIELLTIQIRLIIASVDKAKELGMDWWMLNPQLSSKAANAEKDEEISGLKRRLEKLETQAAPVAQAAGAAT
jgi:hypothetical protein